MDVLEQRRPQVIDISGRATEASMKLPEGLYEQLVDALVDESINETARHDLRAELRALDPGDSHSYLAQYLASKIGDTLAPLSGTNKLERQLELANRIIALLADSEAQSVDIDRSKLLRAELLLAIFKAPPEANPFERPTHRCQ